jgi:hypothetical protein
MARMTSFINADMGQAQLFERLQQSALELDFCDGFKLLYCPFRLLREETSVLFLSLNPGSAPSHFDRESISDERGNSYEVELSETESPLNTQFIELVGLLGLPMHRVLTGAYVPFRTNRWCDLTSHQEQEALLLARSFWSPLIAKHRLTICCGLTVFKDVCRNVDGNAPIEKVSSGWGNTSIGRLVLQSSVIIGLPHLSSYRLMSNDKSRNVLRGLFQEIGLHSDGLRG